MFLFVIMTMGAMYVVKVTYRIYHGSLAGDAPNKAVREEADLAVKAVFSHLDNLFVCPHHRWLTGNRWKTLTDRLPV